ncbi:MAG: prephenate dehydrogenase [Propionibacteriaceae bacterium]|nr:prephenate dehydrogenase [Propionibacteriaceae bacterium]
MADVVIVGAGLVGASIGLALSAAGQQVHLADRVRSHSMVAAGLGAGTIDPPDAEAISLVVVAVPPDALAEVIGQALRRFPNATVTDVGSVKAPVVDAVLGLPGAERYVPSHPMAGSQYAGPLTADATLFVDRTWVITPVPANARADVERVEWLARACGARIVTMSPRDHDVAVAQMSHVPHLMSILTAGHLREVPVPHLRLAGQGIRDVTRIAGSDPGLWRQILIANARAVRAGLEAIRSDLGELLEVLDDPDGLEAVLSRGRAGALSLAGKHGRSAEQLAAVVVEIPDEPRALARLFTDVADLGVNVEDVAIEHDQVRQVGYLAIQVKSDAADQLQGAIVERGWAVRPSVIG